MTRTAPAPVNRHIRPAQPEFGGAAGRPVARRRQRVTLPFLVTALISVLVVSLTSTVVSRSIAENEAIAAAAAAADAAVRHTIEPALTDGVLIGDPDSVAALAHAVRVQILGGPTVRVKLWDRDGRIVWSDEPRLVGQRFPLAPDEIAAFDGTGSDADVSDLSSPENRFEKTQVSLLEVYRSVHTPGGHTLLFEAYSSYDGVTAAAQRIWLAFAPVAVGALVLLELLQLPIAAALARRLRRAQQQREAGLRSALSAVEDERRRIAADLHDGVVQDLAGAAFALGAASRTARTDPVDAEVLDDVADRLRRCVRSLRSLMHDIYPPNLYAGGVAAVLPELVARIVPAGLTTRVDIDGHLPPLPHTAGELVYRVALEGLRNAVRHAAADRVELTLRREGPLVVLVVRDNGRGLDPGTVDTRPGHLGLRALAGMAQDRDAALLLDSAPGRGTVLRLELPL